MSVDHVQIGAATLALILGATLPLQLVLCAVTLGMFIASDGDIEDVALRHVLGVRYRLQWFAHTTLFVGAVAWYTLRRLQRKAYGFEMLGISLLFVGTAAVLSEHLPRVTVLFVRVDGRYGPLFDPSLLYGPFSCSR